MIKVAISEKYLPEGGETEVAPDRLAQCNSSGEKRRRREEERPGVTGLEGCYHHIRSLTEKDGQREREIISLKKLRLS